MNILTTEIFVSFSIKFHLYFDSFSSFWAYFNLKKNRWELETQKSTKIQSFSIPSRFHLIYFTFPFFVWLILLFGSAFVDMLFPEKEKQYFTYHER